MQRRIGQSFCNMREACSLVWSVLVLLFRSRVSLEAEILILRHQLNIQRRHVPKRVAFSVIDRLIFVGLYRLVPTTIKALTIESPIPSSVGTVPVSDRIGAGNPGVAAAARLFCCQLAARTPNLWIGEISVLVLRDEPMERCGRPWFECPLCKRRARHLYLRNPIACRRCLGLLYLAENEQQTPGVGHVERLRRKLGGCDTRPFAPLPARRPGRSKAYHERLVAMIHAEETKLVEHLQTVTRDLERRIAGRKRKHQW